MGYRCYCHARHRIDRNHALAARAKTHMESRTRPTLASWHEPPFIENFTEVYPGNSHCVHLQPHFLADLYDDSMRYNNTKMSDDHWKYRPVNLGSEDLKRRRDEVYQNSFEIQVKKGCIYEYTVYAASMLGSLLRDST